MKTSFFSKIAAAVFVAALSSFGAVMASGSLSLKETDSKIFASDGTTAIDTSELALMANGVKVGNFLESNIRYPALALENGIEGQVRVLAEVGTNGLVKDVKVLSAVDERLANEVIKATKKLSFIPATQNGYAVSYSIIVPVRFDLY